MEAIIELFKVNFYNVFISVFVILIGIKAVVTIFEWAIERLGIETKWTRKRKEEHKLLISTCQNLAALQKRHDRDIEASDKYNNEMKADIKRLNKTVDGIVATLEEMQRKNNETELKKLKDKLVGYYNKYKNIGEWSKLEKDAFWDLFDDYEKRGGDGYVHSIVEPVMRMLREID